MKKLVCKLTALALGACILATGAAIAGCSGGGDADRGDRLHIADTRPLGGDKLLDDGGAINSSSGGTAFIFKNAVYEESAEHKISFESDSDKYETVGGQARGTWSNSGNTYGRFQVTAESRAVIFKLDFTGVEDTSNIGCMVNIIATRGSVLLSVSTDKENWKDIGYNLPTGVVCDAKYHREELNGNEVKDNNLYAMYYLLGEYIGESKVLYLKAGFSRAYFQGASAADNGIGADLIDHIAYYDSIKLVGSSI